MAPTQPYDSGPSPAVMRRHRRALRIMVVVLIPLAIWTVAGLIAFWPGDPATHLAQDSTGYTVAGTTYPKAAITAVTETSCEGAAGSTSGGNQVCATVKASLLDGPDVGQTVDVALTDPLYRSGVRVGQEVTFVRLPPVDDQPASYQFSDFERRTPLLVLGLVFAAVVVLVARWRGLGALVGLGFAGLVLVTFVFPALVSGTNPLVVGVFGASAMLFVLLYATHGVSVRTTTALLGSLAGLVVVAVLGYLWTRWAHLTGVTAEGDYLLAATAPDLRLTSVVICGVLVAGLGVLADVTMTQSRAVWDLADADPDRRDLFFPALRAGRSHAAASVPILAFAAAGAALPVLLLIAVYDRPILDILQTEQFAGAIVRTLVASIGLVLAVPLTTAIGVAVVRASGRRGRADPSASPTTPPGTAPESTPDASEAQTVVIRTGRRGRGRQDQDDLDFSDLRDPSEDETTIRPQR